MAALRLSPLRAGRGGRRAHAGRRHEGLEARRGLGRLVSCCLLDAHAQVVPGGLAGDGIAVGEAVAAGLLGQQLGDQVVEQEAAL
ncbi:MAG: hypothetical protein ACAH24_23515 [Hyphomicrobiaceae bacterium]